VRYLANDFLQGPLAFAYVTALVTRHSRS
jgi:hypothetical protein